MPEQIVPLFQDQSFLTKTAPQETVPTKLDAPGNLEEKKQLATLPPTGEEYNNIISNNQTITDLINDIHSYQNTAEDLLSNYPRGVNGNIGTPSNTGYEDFVKSLHPTKETVQMTNKPVVIGPESEYKRYAGSEDFQALGYTPAMGSEQEYKYGRHMTWGDTVGNALGGSAHLAADTFIEGWKGWGRMADALFSWDSSKLMGSEQERYEMAKKQEEIMNKYAIYDTAESKDSLWNRQFFGNMLQQSGFAIGAGLQFAAEEFLTAGMASFLQPALKGAMIARVIKNTEKVGDLVNDARKVMNTVTNSEKVVNSLGNLGRKIVPLFGTADDMVKSYRAGAGTLQLGMLGVGGIRRTLSEFNMARSESIFEAASTYKQLEDKLVNEYTQTNGTTPQGAELDKIKQYAEDASHDNFWTNIGVLSVMNRIQFDNMFKGFSSTRKIFNETAASLEGKAFEVSGKIAGKEAKRVYQTGILGRVGATGEIAKTFGKRTAAWEATKGLALGLTKFEGSEGLQELIQTASDRGLENYYYDLYHGKKGYGDKMDRVLEGMDNPFTSTEGMKTFLMGALTGRLISPFGMIADRTVNRKDFKETQLKAKEAVNSLNAFYTNPTNFIKESIANVKIQNKAAETMDEAAKNHNKYIFNNAKDSAFAKTVSSAIKLDMFESLRDSISELGKSMSDEEFKKAFDINPTSENKTNVSKFMDSVGKQIEDYYITFNNLKDKYGDRVLPELYKNNKPEEYAKAKIAKMALDDAIEALTTNVYKSKQAVKRASQLQTEISQNKNIGGSSIEVLSKLGSEQAINDHIELLEKEIAESKVPGIIVTPEQRKILDDKKKELDLAKTWRDSYEEIMNNDDASYSPVTEGRAYQAFADLVNLFNKRSKLSTTISKEDVDENFIKFTDYIKLNKDHKEYVEAMNTLADPYNLHLLSGEMAKAITKIGETFKKEHKEEITEVIGKKETSTPNTTSEDYLKEKEDYLKEKYEIVKKAAEESGTAYPPYETWKKTAGIYHSTMFDKAKATPSEKPSEKKPLTEQEKKAAQITKIMSDLASGVGEASANKIKEYADRILSGKETREETIKGLPQSFIDGIDKLLTAEGYEFKKEEPELTVNVAKQIEEALINNYQIADVVNRLKDVKEIIEAFDWALNNFPKDLINKFATGDISARDQLLSQVRSFIKQQEANLKNEEKPIEPEDKPEDYRKVLRLARKINDGNGDFTPQELDILSKYPNLIEQFIKTERERLEEIFKNPKEEEAINDKYDQLLRDIVAKGKAFPKDVIVIDGKNIPDVSQNLDRNKFAQMKADTEYADREYQEGYRQINPSTSLANRTDNFDIVKTPETITYVRKSEINPNYVFDVATPEFPVGANLTYKVITDEEEYKKLGVNRLTGLAYEKAKIFDSNGKVKTEAYDETPIQVIANIKGKDTVIGHIREPLWIQYKINGKYPHIAAPENVNIEEHVKDEIKKNQLLRKTILDAFNKNSKFVVTGHVTGKSNGILKMLEHTEFLKDRINPKIGEGGVNNRHGYFAIVRNDRLEASINESAPNVVKTESFTNNISKYSGIPALMLPTPTGEFMPTFIGLPTVDKGQAQFIIEAWKAFTGQSDNMEIVNAIYESLNRVMSDGIPEIGVLRDYISQYITTLENDKLDKIGSGVSVAPGTARMNIYDDGHIGLEVMDKKGNWFNNSGKPIKNEKQLPENIIDLLQNLRMTIKFEDRRNSDLVGINSTKKIKFLTMKDDKLSSKEMTYNSYVMEKATTYVEKGTPSENTNKDWVYFANPVVQMSYNQPIDTTPDITDVNSEKPNLKDLGEKKEDKGAALLAALRAKKVTDEQIEEKKDECLQTKINNII